MCAGVGGVEDVLTAWFRGRSWPVERAVVGLLLSA